MDLGYPRFELLYFQFFLLFKPIHFSFCVRNISWQIQNKIYKMKEHKKLRIYQWIVIYFHDSDNSKYDHPLMDIWNRLKKGHKVPPVSDFPTAVQCTVNWIMEGNYETDCIWYCEPLEVTTRVQFIYIVYLWRWPPGSTLSILFTPGGHHQGPLNLYWLPLEVATRVHLIYIG